MSFLPTIFSTCILSTASKEEKEENFEVTYIDFSIPLHPPNLFCFRLSYQIITTIRSAMNTTQRSHFPALIFPFLSPGAPRHEVPQDESFQVARRPRRSCSTSIGRLFGPKRFVVTLVFPWFPLQMLEGAVKRRENGGVASRVFE